MMMKYGEEKGNKNQDTRRERKRSGKIRKMTQRLKENGNKKRGRERATTRRRMASMRKMMIKKNQDKGGGQAGKIRKRGKGIRWRINEEVDRGKTWGKGIGEDRKEKEKEIEGGDGRFRSNIIHKKLVEMTIKERIKTRDKQTRRAPQRYENDFLVKCKISSNES